MYASKANKVYSITEPEKQRYVDSGFDILDDKGNVIKYGKGKTVPYDDYAKMKKRAEELEAELDSLKPKASAAKKQEK